MKQYKTVPGPININVDHGASANDAVKQYQVIIEREAVDGWEFYCIEPISVREKPPEPDPIGCMQETLISLGFAARPSIPEGRNYSINMVIFVKDNK
ncbi:MAG: hypothetical protein FWB94_06185 [Chitinispirillia bacterium]|nr:hypothetical protein [Chitinispirillia bacterium]